MIAEFEGRLNENDMVIDFYDVDKIIKPLVEKLDHGFMVNKTSKYELHLPVISVKRLSV